MRKEYKQRIRKYCKSRYISIKDFCLKVGIDRLTLANPNVSSDTRLITLIILEPYIKDMEFFKIDVCYRIRNLISDYSHKYLDKDLISSEDCFKIYNILKPYMLNMYQMKNN